MSADPVAREQAAIRRMVKLRAEGVSLREIAAELERIGHLNERGVRYSAASVQHMLAQQT